MNEKSLKGSKNKVPDIWARLIDETVTVLFLLKCYKTIWSKRTFVYCIYRYWLRAEAWCGVACRSWVNCRHNWAWVWTRCWIWWRKRFTLSPTAEKKFARFWESHRSNCVTVSLVLTPSMVRRYRASSKYKTEPSKPSIYTCNQLKCSGPFYHRYFSDPVQAVPTGQACVQRSGTRAAVQGCV